LSRILGGRRKPPRFLSHPAWSLLKRREVHPGVRRRKSFCEEAIYDERPEPENRTPGVNLWVSAFAEKPKAPQIIRPENRCILDRGVWQVKKLRRGQVVELTPWATLFSVDPAPSGHESVKRDPLALARLYLSLLESGLAKSRADVARYFGVSRARVTQVLRRLEQ